MEQWWIAFMIVLCLTLPRTCCKKTDILTEYQPTGPKMCQMKCQLIKNCARFEFDPQTLKCLLFKQTSAEIDKETNGDGTNSPGKSRKVYKPVDTSVAKLPENLKEDLLETKKVWNAHRIQPSRYVAGGRPSILYSVPEIYNTRNYLCEVELDRLEACSIECTFMDNMPLCDEDVNELGLMYMEEYGLALPVDAYEASNLYFRLRNCIRRDLDM